MLSNSITGALFIHNFPFSQLRSDHPQVLSVIRIIENLPLRRFLGTCDQRPQFDSCSKPEEESQLQSRTIWNLSLSS